MRSLALLFAFVVPVATASAASTTTLDPHPLTKSSSQSHRAQWVRMSFCNPTMKILELKVGENSFVLQSHQTLALSITTGSTVHVSSPQDSRLNDQIEVTAAAAYRTVMMH